MIADIQHIYSNALSSNPYELPSSSVIALDKHGLPISKDLILSHEERNRRIKKAKNSKSNMNLIQSKQ